MEDDLLREGNGFPKLEDFLRFLFSFWKGETRDFPQKGHSWNFGFILRRERATANPADRSTRARAGTLPPAPVDGQPKITVNNDVPNT